MVRKTTKTEVLLWRSFHQKYKDGQQRCNRLTRKDPPEIALNPPERNGEQNKQDPDRTGDQV